MSFYDLVQSTLRETVETSVLAFAPELIVCATIVALLHSRQKRRVVAPQIDVSTRTADPAVRTNSDP